jgi:hypothetical protein
MARNEVPFEYVPGPIPDFAPGETAEQYMSKLLPYLRDEFENVRQQFQQLPIIPYELEAPRAPFDGMARAFGDNSNWVPANQGWGVYLYMAGEWWKISLTGPYQHA